MAPTTIRRFPWLPESVESENILRIDWSGYSQIEACFRRAGHLLAWRRERDYDDEAQSFGKAIHAALDWRQRHFGSGPYGPRCQREMEDVLKRHFDDVTLPEGEYRTLGRAKDVIGHYNATWPSEDFEIVASERAAERELGTAWFTTDDGQLGGERGAVKVIWQGKTDGIWRDREGRNHGKDTKTSSRDEFADVEGRGVSKGEAKYKMSGQFKGYCWLFSGDEFGQVRDFILDQVIVRKPIMRRTAASAPENECKRHPFRFTDQQIDEWQRDTLAVISAWLTASARKDLPPPMMTTNCAWPTVCQFLACCENANEDDRIRWLLSGNYRDRTWDPMAKEDERRTTTNDKLRHDKENV